MYGENDESKLFIRALSENSLWRIAHALLKFVPLCACAQNYYKPAANSGFGPFTFSLSTILVLVPNTVKHLGKKKLSGPL